ncbi:helix-turn-helix domain-containing protein [Plantactinospora sp. S1510]|uniref:Helix-turn-helix domain-containing protein n=1 Tax=Plantactinospora alkalitolerans TaxID=2789879 RepID=A0ABS0GWT0_9ACTN|nr:helix-turn-helix domain-containing protein [Plantactinospora alkalitolerans]MBF9130389.1 helix-turn-helix domain-containing protein [Plantactinospora alkalitolerans]
MSALFKALRERVEVNARHAAETYVNEVSEYQTMPSGVDGRTGIYDFAVLIRRRSLDLVAAALPLTEKDLAGIGAVGRQRAEVGLSVPSQQQVLGLHTAMMVREVHDLARPEDVTDLLRMVGWLGAQGVRARSAYLCGYTRGVGTARVLSTRLEILARALLADEPVEPIVADLRLAGRYHISILKTARPVAPETQAEVVAALAADRIPVTWLAVDEVAVLTPGTESKTKALQRVRQATALIGQPCGVGSAEGAVGGLAETLAWAREASRVAPPQDRPERLPEIADLFVEMAVARTPAVDGWLRTYARALAAGPDLVATLRAYYANDMIRTSTAAALHIHPRTLDYRLRRVREVTGIDPGSTVGVRLLSATVARTLAVAHYAD